MKNVAIVNSVRRGSTGKIALGLLKNLQEKGYNATFYYGRGFESKDNHIVKFEYDYESAIHAGLGKLFGVLGNFSFFATKRMLADFKTKKIDTVYLLSPHGYYLNESLFFSFISKNNIHLVYIMIDEYAYLGKCTNAPECEKYQTLCGSCPNIKKYPPSLFLDTCSYIMKRKEKNYKKVPNALFVGPQFLLESSKMSHLRRYMRMKALDEAVDMEVYQPRDANELFIKHNISPNKKIILCVADTTAASKGAHYFTEMVRLFDNDNDFVFIHIGYKNCKDDSLPKNYIAIDYIEKDSDVALYYSMADIMVFPSVFDTMANTCLEALACGTPLLCFNVSGMPYLMDETVGTLVDLGDVNALSKVVRKVSKKTSNTIDICRNYAMKRYNNKDYADKLIRITIEDEKNEIFTY